MSVDNVVVFLLDTLRADHLSAYGYDREQPFFDEFAANNTVYENAYSSSIWSLPAYGSLFTGDLPNEHGGVDWNKTVSADRFLTHDLADRGYNTACVSGHVMPHGYGLADGFDETIFLQNPHKRLLFEDDPVIEELRGGSDESIVETAVRALRLLWEKRSVKTIPNVAYRSYRNATRRLGYWQDSGAKDILSNAHSVLTREEDTFLFANFVETHKPWHLPREYLTTYTDASLSEIDRVNKIDTGRVMMGEETIDDSDRQLMIDLFDASILYLDNLFSDFFERLPDTVTENTMFVFLSDHGDGFGEEGVWEHQGKITKSLSHIPLMIRYPGVDHRTVTGPVSIADLREHITAVVDGDDTPLETTTPYIEYYGWNPQHVERDDLPPEYRHYAASVVENGRRFEWRADGSRTLYDVTSGPSQEVEVEGDTEQYESLIERTIGRPSEIEADYLGRGDDFEMDTETEKHLRDLGYID